MLLIKPSYIINKIMPDFRQFIIQTFPSDELYIFGVVEVPPARWGPPEGVVEERYHLAEEKKTTEKYQ